MILACTYMPVMMLSAPSKTVGSNDDTVCACSACQLVVHAFPAAFGVLGGLS